MMYHTFHSSNNARLQLYKLNLAKKHVCDHNKPSVYDCTVSLSLTFHLNFLGDDDSCYLLLSICRTEMNTFNRHITQEIVLYVIQT